MSIFRFIYIIGIYIRNRKILACYKSLKNSENYSIDKLLKNQETKLRELVNFAYNNSAHYKHKYDECGLNLDKIRSLNDLKYIPVTTKEEVLNNCKSIQVANCDEKQFLSETSGSTGRPLMFYRNMEWDAWVNAAVMRGYSWHDVSPWDRNGYLWGYNIAPCKQFKVKFLDFLQNRFRMFSYKSNDIDSFVKKLENAVFLGGYSSMLYEVAKRINSGGIKHKFNLKMVKGTSEKIYDIYQDEAIKAFGKRIISEYGSAESGIIAFECAFGSLHINMETVIVEEVDNEIVVTNLVSKSFPIIRYKLGDYIKIDTATKCKCGIQHYIISEVTGRVGSVIHGNKNQYPSLTLYYVFKNLATVNNIVLNYQVIQEAIGHIIVLIENEYDETAHGLMMKEFKKYFDDDLNIKVEYSIERQDYKSKKKDFISKII